MRDGTLLVNNLSIMIPQSGSRCTSSLSVVALKLILKVFIKALEVPTLAETGPQTMSEYTYQELQ